MDAALFADAVVAASQQGDGAELAHLFAVHSPLASQLMLVTKHVPPQRLVSALRRCQGFLPDVWQSMCASRLEVLQALLMAAVDARMGEADFAPGQPPPQPPPLVDLPLAATHLQAAVDAQASLTSTLLRYAGTLSPGSWVLPLVMQVLRDYVRLAIRLDTAQRYATPVGTGPSSVSKQRNLEEAARQLNKAFAVCVGDRTSEPTVSRKLGAYAVVNLICKAYFRLNKTSLCKNIVRALDAAAIAPLESFPRKDQVTFHFYMGVLAFLDEHYASAEQHLALAFNQCHAPARHNQELILQFLVPLRLQRGVLPTKELVRAFPRIAWLYGPFLSAFQKGDVNAYDDLLYGDQHVARQTVLIHKGVFPALERARAGCLRTLFRRAWLALDKKTRLPLSALHAAVVWNGARVELPEAEWYLATLIAKVRTWRRPILAMCIVMYF